ncbi:MAG: hypothetical protein WCP23_09495 [Planctomycetota bacterium]
MIVMAYFNNPPPTSTITPDDPRLSEWIDGRLAAAEAAEVERAVHASPDLMQIVDDLRANRSALGQLESQEPAAGFAESLLHSLGAVGNTGSRAAGHAGNPEVDPEVKAEWQRIETQRIAEEQAEAKEDSQAPRVAGRPRWPLRAWQTAAMAGALAAGVLVTLVLNRPRVEQEGRETAMVSPPRLAARSLNRDAADKSVVQGLAEHDAIEDANRRSIVLITAADAPPTGLRVRVRLRDEQGRQRLEELLAASHVRIQTDEFALAKSDRKKESDEIIGGSGTPAAIDALLAALSEPSDSLVLEAVPSESAAADADTLGQSAEQKQSVEKQAAFPAMAAAKAKAADPSDGLPPAPAEALPQALRVAAGSAADRAVDSERTSANKAQRESADQVTKRGESEMTIRSDDSKAQVKPAGVLLWIQIIDETGVEAASPNATSGQ